MLLSVSVIAPVTFTVPFDVSVYDKLCAVDPLYVSEIAPHVKPTSEILTKRSVERLLVPVIDVRVSVGNVV